MRARAGAAARRHLVAATTDDLAVRAGARRHPHAALPRRGRVSDAGVAVAASERGGL
jgi:hypothetical protein